MSHQQAAFRQPRQELARGLSVLLVEDDQADAHLIIRALNQRPNVGEITHAHDGQQALELLERRTYVPDIAIVDLKMPRMDGFRLLVELSCRDRTDFPIVVLTSSTARSDAARSLFRGAERVISKPNSFDRLECEIALAISSAFAT